MPFIGTQPEVGGYSVLDALTASATASYTLQLNSANFVPNSANQLLVSLNGVIQKPGSSFTVSGSTLTFSSALTSSDSIDFILAMGEPLLVGTPSDGTVVANKLATNAVTTAKIADDAVTSAKLDTNISVDGNLGLGTSVSTRKLNVNAGSYGHMLLDTANAAHGIQILGQANAAANSGFDIQYAASTGMKIRTLAVQPLSLQTSASAGSPSNNLHIHTNGVVSIPNGIELGSGVDATAANTLDDYEEGTWTPGISSRSFSGNVKGSYTKIGRLVTVYFDCNTMTGGNITNPSLTGLPFTSTNSADFDYAGFIHISEPYGLAGSYSYVYFRINKNDTGGIMLQGGGNGSSITHASGVTMSDNDHFRGIGQYYTD